MIGGAGKLRIEPYGTHHKREALWNGIAMALNEAAFKNLAPFPYMRMGIVTVWIVFEYHGQKPVQKK